MSSAPSKVQPIPAEYEAPTVYIAVSGAAKAIDFYKKAFNATETMRMPGPDGKIGHADLKIGGGHIMLADEHPELGFQSPKALGGTPVNIMIYVDDVDRVFKQAVDAGAKVIRPVKNEFYGDRMGQLEDPFGHRWYVGTHIEDVSDDEMARRAAEKAKGGDK